MMSPEITGNNTVVALQKSPSPLHYYIDNLSNGVNPLHQEKNDIKKSFVLTKYSLVTTERLLRLRI